MNEIVSVEVSAFSATVGSLAVRQLNDDLFVTSSCPGYERVSSLARKERETTVTQKLKKDRPLRDASVLYLSFLLRDDRSF